MKFIVGHASGYRISQSLMTSLIYNLSGNDVVAGRRLTTGSVRVGVVGPPMKNVLHWYQRTWTRIKIDFQLRKIKRFYHFRSKILNLEPAVNSKFL